MMRKLQKLIKKIITILKKPEMLVLPGQLAFSFVLALVPIITIIYYIASYMHIPTTIFNDFILSSFSKEILDLLTPIVSGDPIDLKIIIFLIIGFFVASSGIESIIVSSNVLYDIKDKSFLKRKIKSIIMTLLLVLLFIFILVIPVFGSNIIDLLSHLELKPHIITNLEFILTILKGPVTWLLIFLIIKLIYIIAPDKHINGYDANYGAIFTTILWVISTYLFSYYVNNFATYELLYAGLSNIVIIMLWFYLLSYILVIGLALNSYADKFNKVELY